MKKSLQILTAVCFAFPALAQQLNNPTQHQKAPHSHAITNASAMRNAPIATASTTIFSEDFASGLPATWTVSDNNTSGEVWFYSTTGTMNYGGLSPLGTSAANGFMTFDSDADGAVGTPENCDLKSPVINCTGNSTVILSFNESYREYALDSSLAQVSNDGVTWTTFYCPDIALSRNQVGPNPNLVTVDISSVAANQATVYLRFHYEGDWDYYWMIDDIKLFVPSATDAVAFNSTALSFEYTKIPVAQAVNMQLSGVVKNYGSTTLTGATALLEVIDTVTNTSVFNTTVSIPSLAPFTATVVISSTNFTTYTPGYYRGRLTVNAAGDGDATNDMVSSSVVTQITDSTYARDNTDSTITSLGIGAGGSPNDIIGQNFNLTQTDVLTSVSFFITGDFSPNPAGTAVYLTIHPQVVATAPTAAIATTTTIMITPGMVQPNGTWFTLPIMGGPAWLNAGLYFVGAHETDSILKIGTSDGIITPGTVWVSWGTIPTPPAVNGWATADDFGFQIQYMIRPNFGTVINSVNENTSTSFGLFPNPTADNISLTFLNVAERTINVYNSTGQLVNSSNCNGKSATIDLSSNAEGVYFVNVTEGNKVSTKTVNIVR